MSKNFCRNFSSALVLMILILLTLTAFVAFVECCGRIHKEYVNFGWKDFFNDSGNIRTLWVLAGSAIAFILLGALFLARYAFEVRQPVQKPSKPEETPPQPPGKNCQEETADESEANGQEK